MVIFHLKFGLKIFGCRSCFRQTLRSEVQLWMTGSKVHSETPAHAYKKSTHLDNEEPRSRLGSVSTTVSSNDDASPRISFSLSDSAMLDESPFLSCQGPLAGGGWVGGEAILDFTSVASADDLRHHVLHDDGERSLPGTPVPATPREVRARNCTTPPPWTRPRAKTVSPLLKAMERNAGYEVRALLEGTPGIAEGLFLDDAFEPPLCPAVRLKCSLDIFELLIAHGADTQAKKNMNRTPIELLRKRVARDTPSHVFPIIPVPWLNAMPLVFEQWHDPVEELLKAGKAKPVG